jgi:hypothetical protein
MANARPHRPQTRREIVIAWPHCLRPARGPPVDTGSTGPRKPVARARAAPDHQSIATCHTPSLPWRHARDSRFLPLGARRSWAGVFAGETVTALSGGGPCEAKRWRFNVTQEGVNVLMAELRGYALAWWFPSVLDEVLAAMTRLDAGLSTTATIELANEPGKAFQRWLVSAALRTRCDPATAEVLDRVHRSRR